MYKAVLLYIQMNIFNMKIQFRRKSGNTVLPAAQGAAEPILSTLTIGNNTYDTIYIRNLANNAWKAVAMTDFTPSYEEVQSSSISSSIGNYNFWFGTQNQYDAIATKDPDTFYFITQ